MPDNDVRQLFRGNFCKLDQILCFYYVNINGIKKILFMTEYSTNLPIELRLVFLLLSQFVLIYTLYWSVEWNKSRVLTFFSAFQIFVNKPGEC